jgi:hypothetical protein
VDPAAFEDVEVSPAGRRSHGYRPHLLFTTERVDYSLQVLLNES